MRQSNRLDKLMRRARRGADELLQLAKRTLPSEALAELHFLKWPITSLDQLREGRAALRKKAWLSCGTLKPERALPSLIDATSRHYSQTHSVTAQALWLGPALKTCMTLTWPNVHTGGARSCTTNALWNSIGVCAAYQQLYWAEFLFVFAGGSGQIDLTQDGLVFSEELLNVQALLNRARSERTTGLRLPDFGAGPLAADLAATRRAIVSVLNGTPAKEIDHLRETPLAAIPPGHGEELLSHLWLTAEIAHAASLTSTLLHGHNEGVVLIPHPVPATLPEQMKHRIGSVVPLLFWTKDWFASLEEDDLLNAIIERPILRCDYNGDFYATCLIFVLNALAWAIEAAFFRYPRMTRLYLPSIAFDRAFSDPHEERVIEICRAAGLRAGPVSQSGVWRTQHGIESLVGAAVSSCPGEIDCLALTPDRRSAFVFECKVLWLPRTYVGVRNVVGKLNRDDTDGFHAKLTRKAVWVETVLEAQNIRTALVLDRTVPLVKDSPHPVVLLSELNSYLNAQETTPRTA